MSELWRDRDFLKLWTANTVTQLGTQVTFLALPLAAILVLHASALEVALLGAAEMAPLLLFNLPAGVWVDRMRRRPLMIAADLGRAASLASIPVAHAFGALTLGQLYGVAFLNGFLAILFDLAYLTFLPALVAREQLSEGNAKLEASRAGAQLAGPGLAGGLIGLIGAPAAITADAASFGLSGALVSLIRRREEPPAREGREPLWTELREGVRYVLGQPYLRILTVCTGAWSLFASMMAAVFLVYAVRTLDLSAGVIGIIFMLGNAGQLVAAAGCSRVTRRFGVGPTIVWAGVISSLFLVVTPLAPKARPEPFLAVGFAVEMGAGMLFNINQLTLRQAITPKRLLGRMTAVVRFMYLGAAPLGFLIGGVVASQIGLRAALWFGAIGAIVAMLPLPFSSIRLLQTLPEIDEEPDLLPLAVPPLVELADA